MLQVGSKAPTFRAKSTHGEIDLNNYLGKQSIVLIFYPKDDSFICTKQLCAVRDSKKQYEQYNALVLGVNSGSIEEHQAFANKFSYDFPIISDEDNLINQAYQVGNQFISFLGQHRIVYVVNVNGIVTYAKKGNRPTAEIIEALKS